MRPRPLLASILFALLLVSRAQGASLAVSTSAGVMQQPTSHYYHACYGMNLDAATDKQNFLARISYVERPEFVTSVATDTNQKTRFADKEFAGFVLIGSKLTKTRSHGLYALFGAGQMRGYITSSTNLDRKFSLPGVTAMAEYQVQKKQLVFAAGHQTFVGYVDKTQLNALVAWPYNFFQASIGYRW